MMIIFCSELYIEKTIADVDDNCILLKTAIEPSEDCSDPT